jgi:hypothetical protein
LPIKRFKSEIKLATECSREQTINEIAEKLQISQEDVIFALDAIQEPYLCLSPFIMMAEIRSLSWIKSAMINNQTAFGWNPLPSGKEWESWESGKENYFPSFLSRQDPDGSC